MCDICWPVFGKKARRHPTTPCPLAKALYCTVCASYGHKVSACVLRREFVAEPATETLYPVDPVPDVLTGKVFIVADDETCIKGALIVNGVTPMICQGKGKRERKEYRENKKRLIDLAAAHGSTLILCK